ncbi:MAG: hypothetical protein NZ480_08735 [Bdellovibrionaceae bacterium]|nr:hypothetical protein [Pseudobdellovibrionaceae bacterium]MDW8189587.1 FtsX-like permease family protein [Pseudobdellovibrionaceae bacterium]
MKVPSFRLPILWFSLYFFRAFLLSSKAPTTLKRIALISTLSLFISFSAFILIISIMNDLNLKVRKRLLTHEPHLVVSQLPEHSVSTYLMELKKINEIESIYLLKKQDLILFNWKGHFQGVTAIGVPKNQFLAFIQRLSPDKEMVSSLVEKPGIILGRELAENMGTLPGDQVRFLPLKALLGGQTEIPKFGVSTVQGYLTLTSATWDRSTFFYLQEQQDSLGLPQENVTIQFFIWLHDSDQSLKIQKQLQKQWPQLQIATWQEREHSMFLALRLEKIMISLFLSIASLVALFAVIMTVALLISQKSKDFILMRLLGMSVTNLKHIVLALSFWLGGVGVIVGASFGTLVAWYLQEHPWRILPDIYQESDISAIVHIPTIVMIVTLGLVATLLIARRLVELLPKEKLAQHLRE